MSKVKYDDSSIKSLDWKEHIRLRPGMYIGKLGDGSSPDDGIYVLVKEVVDNSIDEFVMGNGNKVEITITDDMVTVRDYGRGIPLGKVIDCVSKINTGAKYDSEAFKKAVGLNGVGTKAVNALSEFFKVTSFRDGKSKEAEFSKGELKTESKLKNTKEKPGTLIEFKPDPSIFKNYRFRPEFLRNLFSNYAYLNCGLTIKCNDDEYSSKNGLLDLLEEKLSKDVCYPIVHLKSEDIEVAITHTEDGGEVYYSFVNGQYTTQGGTHQAALREAFVKVVRDHFKKTYDPIDIRNGIVAAISVRIEEPVFESQTKTKLGSQTIKPPTPESESPKTIRSFVNDFLSKNLDNHLHKNKTIASALHQRVLVSEKERKELAGIKKLAQKRGRNANIFNKKLRDCKYHFNKDGLKGENTMIFITEGESASGSITQSRNTDNQAVFSLGGKPKNSYGKSKKLIYENEELNLLQHALNLEYGLNGLRYKDIILATDADIDGMHIRLLLLTFFLQYFPDVVANGHVSILKTPLFRVRNKEVTKYCYDEKERDLAIKELSKGNQSAEVTRFKGLGEISPDEFSQFIGKEIKLDRVEFNKGQKIASTLRFYMGENSEERKDFIINNLREEI